MFELGTVINSLFTENVSENSNYQVIGVVLGILDHSVNEEEFNSDIFEAVGSEQQSNTVPLDDISDFDSRFVGLAGI